jgi:ribosomal protein S18 acetylase RimI-like enzyme
VSERAVEIRPAHGAEDMATLRALFLEYQDWLQVDLCFQDFETELATLPGGYAPPAGALWLAYVNRELAGCVGLRPHEAKAACEMKRLWLRPNSRGLGLGRRLAVTCIAAARAAGYRTICLDTLSFMDAARSLYADLGFHEIPAYYDNPLDDVRYLELDLSAAAQPRA